MAKGNLRLVSSRAVNGTVPPRRVPNAELRTREYLDEFEVERLMRAAKANRNGQRDAAMVLIAFRHGLRAAEIVDLRWDQVDLGRNACLHVRRVKNGMPSVHPLQRDEMRALKRSVERHSPARASRRWWPDWARKLNSSSVFTRTCCAMRAATHWRTEGTI